jgi:hypothetical protein
MADQNQGASSKSYKLVKAQGSAFHIHSTGPAPGQEAEPALPDGVDFLEGESLEFVEVESEVEQPGTHDDFERAAREASARIDRAIQRGIELREKMADPKNANRELVYHVDPITGIYRVGLGPE